MHLGVRVEAAVGQDGEVEVQVGGLAQGGQHDAAGGDAGEDEVIDAAGPEDNVQVTAGEGADPLLGDDDVVGLGATSGWISMAWLSPVIAPARGSTADVVDLCRRLRPIS
jgi:hypothetical protein